MGANFDTYFGYPSNVEVRLSLGMLRGGIGSSFQCRRRVDKEARGETYERDIRKE